MKNYFYLFLLLLSTGALNAQSNLFVDSSLSPEEMLEDFFNSDNITILNPVYTGAPEAIGFFDAGNINFGLDAGILFTTGKAIDAANPATMFISTDVNETDTTPDVDLAQIVDVPLNDKAVLEFDFIATEADVLSFQYIFASEEYPNYTCTTFNDLFGFFVSGPGITGPYSNGAHNICTIPNTDEVVSINTVNNDPDCGEDEWAQYYINNEGSGHIAYDGRTTMLNAVFPVMAQETYHAKLVISDGGDGAFDSGIFLSFSSLGADSLLVPPTDFVFQLTDDDMLIVEENTKYASSWHWDFGNGETSTERNPEPVQYDEPGTYTVTLTTQNFCCTNTYSETFTVGEVSNVFDNTLEESPITIFPNPVINNTFIVESLPNLDLSAMKVIDLLGKEHAISYQQQGNTTTITLPHDLNSGIYFVQATWADGQSTTTRFVKK